MCVVFTDKNGQPIHPPHYLLTAADDAIIATALREAAAPITWNAEDVAGYNETAARCGERDRITELKTELLAPTAQRL